MKKSLLLLLFIVLIFFFPGVVNASVSDDGNDGENAINTIDDIKDLFDLLDMVRENKKNLDYQLEDPTNQTRMTESVENTVNRGVNLLLGVDPTDTDALADRVESYLYSIFALAVFLVILSFFGSIRRS